MAWKKSHKWILEPTTRLERKHILDLVRENHHMVMVHPKKYYDSDNGKYDIDRIETINSHALSEFCDNGAYTHPPYSYRNDNQYEHIPYFVPRDNDFDEECRRDEEDKERKRIEEERKKKDESDYEKLLAEAEQRANYFQLMRAYSPQPGKFVSNVRPNKWKPK